MIAYCVRCCTLNNTSPVSTYGAPVVKKIFMSKMCRFFHYYLNNSLFTKNALLFVK